MPPRLHALGIDLFLHQQGVDTTTPAGKALFQMMGVFAEFERAMIPERVKSGLERAKAQGKTLGRRPRRFPDLAGSVHRMAREEGNEAIARLVGELARPDDTGALPAFAPGSPAGDRAPTACASPSLLSSGRSMRSTRRSKRSTRSLRRPLRPTRPRGG